ncbi:MAG: hypothetical protein IJX39_02320 [Clostridia bacterium]|nr:hypothetical protein [Clostridia bacterium]
MKKRLLSISLSLLLLLLGPGLVACDESPSDKEGTAVIDATDYNASTGGTRYQAAPTKDPYAEMISFRDEQYYYYMLPLGTLSDVPLEDDVASCRYDGNSYTYTLTTEIATSESVENTIEEATSHCVTKTGSGKFEVSGELWGAETKVELGYSKSKADSNTYSQSVKNAVEKSESASRTVEISFNEKNAHGYYRWILMGQVEVYAVVLYDIAQNEYHYDTYSVIRSSAYWLDYSTSMSFDDNAYGQLAFAFDQSKFEGLVPEQWITYDELSEGDGSAGSPFIINSATQFVNLATGEGQYSKLMGDIDFGGQTISPIALFSGHLDGNGYRIYNFKISSGSKSVGLFKENKGTVKNLIIGKSNTETIIEASQKNGSLYVGGIAAINNGTIENCKVEGVTVSGTVKRTENGRIYCYVGGIAGNNQGSITNCTVISSSVSAAAKHDSNDYQNTYAYTGGIAGWHSGKLSDSYVTQCEIKSYASTKAFALDDASAYSIAGGLAGHSTSSCTISQCITNANTVSCDGSASGGWDGHEAKLYTYDGLLLGERESNSVFEQVAAVGESDLIGNGDQAACTKVSQLSDIPFYSSSFGFRFPQ